VASVEYDDPALVEYRAALDRSWEQYEDASARTWSAHESRCKAARAKLDAILAARRAVHGRPEYATLSV
jgi:hypothetical protein